MLLLSKDSKCLRAEIKRRKHADKHGCFGVAPLIHINVSRGVKWPQM
jgi:hypothetical protein